MDPTKIPVSQLLKGSVEKEDVNIKLHLDDVGNGVVDAVDGDSIELTGRIKKFTNSVQFKGRACVEWQGLCSYGNIEVQKSTCIDFDEIFENDSTWGQTYELSGDFIDVEELIRDNLIPELPQFPVCESDGKTNRCVKCSEGLNLHKKTNIKKDVWSELDKLKFEE
jgi:uncharacterized metal-binding protein YceD (DUF177 family)